MTEANMHVCENISNVHIDLFHQKGTGVGKNILIVGESPSPRGWHCGVACRSVKGTLLPTGKRLNELLDAIGVSVETCGFTELSKCFAENRKELKECSKKCYPLFLEQLERSTYRLIVILGVNTTSIFSDLANVALPMGEVKKVALGTREYNILPLYHPSPINPTGHGRNKDIFDRSSKEIRRAVK